MRINTNLNAMTALNQMSKNTALAGASMGKISSGERINKAGDDAAGLAISEKMRSQIRGLDQASKNTQDGISVVQTAEGAMEEIGNIAQRMRELSVQAANETNSVDDREKVATELTQLRDEVTRISEATEFNEKKILNGGGLGVTITNTSKMELDSSKIAATDVIKITSAAGTNLNTAKITVEVTKADGSTMTQAIDNIAQDAKDTLNFNNLGIKFDVDGTSGTDLLADFGAAGQTGTVAAGAGNLQMNIKAGANTGSEQSIQFTLNKMDADTLGITQTLIDNITNADIPTGTTNANLLTDALDNALKDINEGRANLGAIQNRLESAQSNLTTSSENLTAAESRIRDVDVAKEMMNLSKLNLLTQASQAMAGQAKQQPEGIMQLLR